MSTMKADPDCVPYALNMVLATARLVTEDEWIHRKVLLCALADLAAETDLERSAPEIIFSSVQTAYKALGVKDPYENEKARANKAVGALEKDFRAELDASDNRLAAALDLALQGTILDTGVHDRGTAERLLAAARAQPVARDDRQELVRTLARAEQVVYLLNNAGEAVLDKLFIEEIARGRTVTAVVRHAPILNDVTLDDAQALGLGDVEGVEILTTGAPMLGLSLEKAGKQVRDRFAAADVVVSKGQSNYESLARVERDVFFLLRARSVAIARRLGVDQGAAVALGYEPDPAAGPTPPGAASRRKKRRASRG